MAGMQVPIRAKRVFLVECFVIQGGNKNKSITEIGAIYCFSLKSISMLWKIET